MRRQAARLLESGKRLPPAMVVMGSVPADYFSVAYQSLASWVITWPPPFIQF